jgi:hypothetical protein
VGLLLFRQPLNTIKKTNFITTFKSFIKNQYIKKFDYANHFWIYPETVINYSINNIFPRNAFGDNEPLI